MIQKNTKIERINTTVRMANEEGSTRTGPRGKDNGISSCTIFVTRVNFCEKFRSEKKVLKESFLGFSLSRQSSKKMCGKEKETKKSKIKNVFFFFVFFFFLVRGKHTEYKIKLERQNSPRLFSLTFERRRIQTRLDCLRFLPWASARSFRALGKKFGKRYRREKNFYYRSSSPRC